MTDLPPERSVERLRYLNTPTSNWAADRIEQLEKHLAGESKLIPIAPMSTR